MDLHQDFEAAAGQKLQVVNFFEQRKTRLAKVWLFQWETFVSSLIVMTILTQTH